MYAQLYRDVCVFNSRRTYSKIFCPIFLARIFLNFGKHYFLKTTTFLFKIFIYIILFFTSSFFCSFSRFPFFFYILISFSNLVNIEIVIKQRRKHEEIKIKMGIFSLNLFTLKIVFLWWQIFCLCVQSFRIRAFNSVIISQTAYFCCF